MEPRPAERPEAPAQSVVEPPSVSIGKGLALVGKASGVGVSAGFLTAGFTVGGLFLGMWVDRVLGTRPAFTLAFVLGSIPISLAIMVWFVLRNARRMGRAETFKNDGARES